MATTPTECTTLTTAIGTLPTAALPANLINIPNVPGGPSGATIVAQLPAIQAILAQVATFAALCPGFCAALLACPLTSAGLPAGTTLTTGGTGGTGALGALTTFFGVTPASAASLAALVTAFNLSATGATGLGPFTAALQTCITNSLADCFAACPPNPGNLFCPGFGSSGSPISIQITNTARNDDQDQVVAQAGKGNNADQDQKFITAAAGDDVVINGFKKRFDEFDEKLRFLLCKLKEDNKKPCKCKKSGCKY